MQQKIALELLYTLPLVFTNPQRQIFTVDYGTMRAPIQNPLKNFITWVGKPQSTYNLLILSKLTKLGVSVFAE